MVGQLKNAALKMRKVQQGDATVSEEELKELEAKQQFWTEYCSLGHSDEKKAQMLEAFSLDRTCTKWASRSKEISAENFSTATGSDGFLSSTLVLHFNVFVCFLFLASSLMVFLFVSPCLSLLSISPSSLSISLSLSLSFLEPGG